MQAVARYAPRGNGSRSIIVPGSTLSLATKRILIASSASSSIITHPHGRSTVIPASADDSLFTASIAVPICIAASRPSSNAPPSPPASEDSVGTSMTSRPSTTTEPTQSTLSVTLSWSLSSTNPVTMVAKMVKSSYESIHATRSPEPSPRTSIATRGAAAILRGVITRIDSTPLTTRYEPPKQAPRKDTIPSAYPTSSRLDATASKAPTIPIETETPQSPG